MGLVSKCFSGFLFDLDGTVIDTIELISRSFRHASRVMLGEVLPDEVLLANVGQPLMKQMEVLGGERAGEWYETYREFNHRKHDEFIRPYQGVEAVLAELRRRGAGLAVVTSKSRETVDMAFRCIPIEGYFDTVVTADDTDRHKPDPQPVQLAMRRLDLLTDESVYIGDSPFDIEAGHAACVATAAVGWGLFTPVRLKEMEPDFYFEEPDEILQLCPPGREPK
ncbi:MAG TPA: HAD family hydrolase [Actinobacteria bacterium]|nr:HAD family hydrolase [Actinomycetota bacterium]